MNLSKSILTIVHKNHSIILNKVLFSWMCPTIIYMWNADITTCLNLKGTTTRLSFLTLAVCGVS